ncbi:hypothetical protein G6M26_05715 [Agrobacterium tumefaciens]|nr:hypothetical protein [Agrobacterium tumefaciens]NTE18012.1 hypothetical protein [Agrobacterium tumefaciens]
MALILSGFSGLILFNLKTFGHLKPVTRGYSPEIMIVIKAQFNKARLAVNWINFLVG